MTDHHDFGDHDDFGHFEAPDTHEDFGHFDQPQFEDHHELFDEPGHYEAPPVDEVHHEVPLDDPLPVHDTTTADDDVLSVTDPVEVFPPALDVGELPEPVDGFPWIDTGSLGIVHAAASDTPEPVRPEELAEYAGVDLPPAQDPWAALADSDDPATSTLARWWQEN